MKPSLLKLLDEKLPEIQWAIRHMVGKRGDVGKLSHAERNRLLFDAEQAPGG